MIRRPCLGTSGKPVRPYVCLETGCISGVANIMSRCCLAGWISMAAWQHPHHPLKLLTASPVPQPAAVSPRPPPLQVLLLRCLNLARCRR